MLRQLEDHNPLALPLHLPLSLSLLPPSTVPRGRTPRFGPLSLNRPAHAWKTLRGRHTVGPIGGPRDEGG